MKRDEILAILREFKRDCAEKYGILELGLFGSVAREPAALSNYASLAFSKTPTMWFPSPKIIWQCISSWIT